MKKFLSLAILFFLANCASIVSGRNQTVSVETVKGSQSLSKSDCKLSNSKGDWYAQNTPNSVFIRKSYGDLSINCNNKNLSGSQTFKSSHEPIVWGNLLFGGLIGWAIDAGTGSGFSYPQTMVVELK